MSDLWVAARRRTQRSGMVDARAACRVGVARPDRIADSAGCAGRCRRTRRRHRASRPAGTAGTHRARCAHRVTGSRHWNARTRNRIARTGLSRARDCVANALARALAPKPRWTRCAVRQWRTADPGGEVDHQAVPAVVASGPTGRSSAGEVAEERTSGYAAINSNSPAALAR